MELLTHKLAVVPVLVCVRLCVGLSPLVACSTGDRYKSRWVDLLMAIGFSLAGGILLATVFVHMMPEVRSAMHHFLPSHRLPLSELLLIAGFLFTFLIDEMIISLRTSKVYPIQDSDEVDRPPTPPPRMFPRGVLLCLHGLGQGSAVGLAGTVPSTWLMAASSGVAGSIDSVNCSLRLLTSTPRHYIAAFCVLVTSVMATGMILGTLMWSLGIEGPLLAVLKGLAAGNLLYQAMFELLTKEVRARAMGLLSFFVCAIGFLSILFIELIDLTSLTIQSSNRIPTQEPAEEPEYENTYPGDI